MADWNAISAFMRAVVAWPGSDQDPGYINLHYSFPNPDPDPAKVKKKPKLWAGWPYKDIDKFNGGLKWTFDHPDRAPAVYFCTSLQGKKGINKKGKDKAERLAKDALAFKSIWIDCDVRPDDTTGKHYLTDEEALKALLAFVAKVKLPQPTIVKTGGGFHVYWISANVLSPVEWYPYASGLKNLLIQEGVKCDTGLTTDYVRILRVPGSYNRKYDPPREVKIITQVTVHDFAHLDFLKLHAGATPSTPSKPEYNPFADGVTAATFGALHPDFAAFKGEPDLNAGLAREEHLLDPLPIMQQCGFMRDALINGGQGYDQTLWMLSVLCSTFMEDGNVIAHKISNQHAEYSETDTQALYDRKLDERARQGIGYPSCATIAGAGCEACKKCPLFAAGKSPLNIRPTVTATVTPQAPSAAVINGLVDDPSYWLPNGFELNDDGVVCKVLYDKDDDGNETTSLMPLFQAVLSHFWVGLAGGVDEKLHYRASADKGHSVEAAFSMEVMTKQDFCSLLGKQRVLINPQANTKYIQEFHLSTLGKLRAAFAAQKSVPFGWYEENGVRRGFVYGGKIMLDDGTERPCGATDPVIARNYAPVGEMSEWEKACRCVTDRKRPELNAILLLSFLSPLLELVGRETVMMSAYSPDSGGGKSSSYKVGMAVWGHPLLTKGTESQTVNNITTIMKTIRNLPFYWDEITNDDDREKVRKVMHEADGGKEKGRNLDGVRTQDAGTWALALHYASNGSYLSFLRKNNQNTVAAVSRVLEFEVPRIDGTPSNRPPGWMDDADATLLINQTYRNYGLMGMRYARYLANHHKAIAAQCVAEINKAQKLLKGGNTERYWYAAVGLMICAARYAKEMGVEVDPVEIEKFMYKVYDDNLRAREEFSSGGNVDNSEAALTRYLKERDAQERVIWTNYMHNAKGKPPKPVVLLKQPTQAKNTQGGIEARFAVENKVLVISRKDFTKWLAHEKYADNQIYAGLARVYHTYNQRLNITSGWLQNPGREDCVVLRINPGTPLWDYMMNPVDPGQRADLETAAPLSMSEDDAA